MMKTTRTRTHGFSLLELLLSVMVFASVLMAVFGLMRYFSERELARASNKYMATVADATSQILDNVDSFNALYTAAANNGGTFTLIADTAVSAPSQNNIAKDFQLNGVWIQQSRLLNRSFRGNNSPLRSSLSIILRVANNPAGAKGLDILVVTDTARPDNIVRMAASMAGEAGGTIRTYNNKAAASARINSAYGSWNIPLNTLATTPWYTSLPSPLNSRTTGSFLAYYRYANLGDKTGDYLYRKPQTDAGLNTMYGAFNIGGNDIMGADDLSIGNHVNGRALSTSDAVPAPAECDGGVLCVNGTAALKGSGTIGGTMVTNGSALVADSMNVGTMRIRNNLPAAQRQEYLAENLLVVDGSNNTQDTIEVTSNARFVDGGTVQNGSFGSIGVENSTMPDGGVLSANTSNNNRRITSGHVDANSLSVADQLKAGKVVGGPAFVTGKTGTIDISGVQDLQYGSETNPRTFTVPVLHSKMLRVDSFGACTSGCGQ